MDAQTAINLALGLAGVLGGWILNSLKQSIDNLHQSDLEMADKVHNIDVLVAGHYVRRDEMEKLGNALFSKLDRIENKLDGKVDK